MDARNDKIQGLIGQRKMFPLYCVGLLVLLLAGCATTGTRTPQLALKSLSSCEQDLAKIRLALCSGELEAKPGTDPHDVIGLAKPGTDPHDADIDAKPGTDPHKACIVPKDVSAFDGASCSCEVVKTKLMGNIMGCYEKAKGNATTYKLCLDIVKSTIGLTCPSL